MGIWLITPIPFFTHMVKFMDIEKILMSFLFFRSQIKLFHWASKSYARHEALDELEEQTSEIVDDLIESMMATDVQPESTDEHEETFKYMISDTTGNTEKYLEDFIGFLGKLKKDVTDGQSNKIDELMSCIEKALYKLKYLG